MLNALPRAAVKYRETEVLEIWVKSPCPANLKPQMPKKLMNMLKADPVRMPAAVKTSIAAVVYFLSGQVSIRFQAYISAKAHRTVAAT